MSKVYVDLGNLINFLQVYAHNTLQTTVVVPKRARKVCKNVLPCITAPMQEKISGSTIG